MNPVARRAVASLLPVLALVSCTTTGVGSGRSLANDVQATFVWKWTDDRTGTLAADLSNGDRFAGQFFQITSETRIDQIGPLWAGWPDTWGGWRYWDRQPSTAFLTHYSGRVVANLEGPGGQHMRCHFHLLRPGSGMAGGGEGQCQLPSGITIHATFPRS
jgi:hypothetical protein